MSLSRRKKFMLVGATVGMLGIASVAFAYFTTSGTGSGSASIGDATPLVLHQDTITYSNAGTDNVLLPGTSATVTFTVDNPSSGHQQLGTIAVASVESDKAGCDSATHSDWFTSNTNVVNYDYAPGDGQAVTGSITVNFVDAAVSQDICKGATLTFNYAA